MSEGVITLHVVVEVAQFFHFADLVVGVRIAREVRTARVVHVVLLCGFRDLVHRVFVRGIGEETSLSAVAEVRSVAERPVVDLGFVHLF